MDILLHHCFDFRSEFFNKRLEVEPCLWASIKGNGGDKLARGIVNMPFFIKDRGP